MYADNVRTGLNLVFEDSSEIRFEWVQIKELCIDHCFESVDKIGDDLVFAKSCESAHIKISPDSQNDINNINVIYQRLTQNDSNRITQIILGGVKIENVIPTELTYHTSSPNSYALMHEDVRMDGDDLIIDMYY